MITHTTNDIITIAIIKYIMYHKSELITSSAPLIDQEAVLSTIPTNGFQTLGAGGLGGVTVTIFTVKFEDQ